MGEIAINPVHNVFNKYKSMIYVNPYLMTAPAPVIVENTFIGGVASTIYTAQLLATKLAIDVSRITAFSVLGSDIKCKITGSYTIPINCFQSNTTVSKYDDNDGLVSALGIQSFFGTTQIKELDFKNCLSVGGSMSSLSNIENIILANCTTIEDGSFQNHTALKLTYIPRVTALGSTAGINNVFATTPKIYANPSLQTNNAGGLDGDLVGKNAIFVTNFTASNAVTNLSAGTIYNTAIQLNFTPPSSTNAIDYYECYADGVFKNKITASGQYVTGLTANTAQNLTVKAVDIFMNKSVVSNNLSVSTNATAYLGDKVISAYSLSNGLDAKSGYNGTVGSSITYSAGVNGNGANFNNTTNSFISIPDNNDFSFTNGNGTDKPFSISCFVKFNNLNDQWIINKRGATSGTDEWQLIYYLNKLRFICVDANNANTISCDMTTPLVASTQYHILATYSGSEINAGLKLYINGVLQTTTNSTTGTYTGMPNGTSPVVIGKAGWFDGLRLNGQLDELYIFNAELTQSEATALQTSFYPF